MMLARGRDHEVFDRAIDVQVSRLRKLIEPDPANPRYIQTVWGFGYVYVPDAAPRDVRIARPRHRVPRDSEGNGGVTLLPRSLFGRLVLLLIAVVALAVLTSVVMFRHDRAELLTRQFSDTEARAAAGAARGAREHGHRCIGARRCTAQSRIRGAHRARGRAAEHRPAGAWDRCSPTSRHACASGSDPTPRSASRRDCACCSCASAPAGKATGSASRCRSGRSRRTYPSRALTWTLIVLALLLAAAYLFARFLARPLRELTGGRRARRPRRDAAAAAGNRTVGNRRGQPRLQRDAGQSAPDRTRPRRAARGRFARPAHAARAPAPGRRDGHRTTRRCAAGMVGRHRGNGPDHRPVPRLRARRQRDGAGARGLDAIVAACVDRYAQAGRP